ncbi:MAG: hypothetical protein HY868_06025 [Chloroflexi bacterium]|nr:hypothetical protein [Chloroflexota bacterium]
MKRCPRCDATVADTQVFCGSCGNDMRAVPVVPAPRITPTVGEGQTSPYAYPQQMSPYAPNAQEPMNGQSPTMRYVIIGAVVLIVACCAFSCGILASFAIDPLVAPILRGASPTPTRTPRGTPPAGGALVWILWYLLP